MSCHFFCLPTVVCYVSVKMHNSGMVVYLSSANAHSCLPSMLITMSCVLQIVLLTGISPYSPTGFILHIGFMNYVHLPFASLVVHEHIVLERNPCWFCSNPCWSCIGCVGCPRRISKAEEHTTTCARVKRMDAPNSIVTSSMYMFDSSPFSYTGGSCSLLTAQHGATF